MTIGKVDATLIAQNTFTDEIEVHGPYNVSISGISGDTVTLQRSFDQGTLWKDVESYTSDAEDSGEETERGALYRLGVKTDNFSAGTILARISF